MTLRRLRFAASVALLPLTLIACKGREAAATPETPAAPAPAEAAAAPAVQTAAANPPSVTREFRDWTATCDNTNHCVAFGSAEENMGFVIVSLAPGPDARPVVHMGGWGLQDGQGDVYAEIDGRRYAGKTSKMDEEGDVIAFRTPSAELLRDLGNGSFMALRRGDEKMKVSLGGAAAAFEGLDRGRKALGSQLAQQHLQTLGVGRLGVGADLFTQIGGAILSERRRGRQADGGQAGAADSGLQAKMKRHGEAPFARPLAPRSTP